MYDETKLLNEPTRLESGKKVGEQTMATAALPQEIFLRGPLYRNEINALRAGLTRCLDDGAKLLALDLSQVEYIDCAGLGQVLAIL